MFNLLSISMEGIVMCCWEQLYMYLDESLRHSIQLFMDQMILENKIIGKWGECGVPSTRLSGSNDLEPNKL